MLLRGLSTEPQGLGLPRWTAQHQVQRIPSGKQVIADLDVFYVDTKKEACMLKMRIH
jgi:hypothetical protein